MEQYLYHYTDKVGRDGICNKNNIWLKLTSRSRNDTKDTIYIRDVLSSMQNEIVNEDYFLEKAFSVLNSVLNPIGFEKEKAYIEKNIFMFCTMQNVDDYAGKEFYDPDIEVYRISFNKNRLMNSIKSNALIMNHGVIKNGDVTYEVSLQKEEINKILKKFKEEFLSYRLRDSLPFFHNSTNLAATPTNDYSGISGFIPDFSRNKGWFKTNWNVLNNQEKNILGEMWVSLANEFYWRSTFIKDPQYKGEKEYRIAFLARQGFQNSIKVNSKFCIEVEIDSDCIITSTSVGAGTNKKMKYF